VVGDVKKPIIFSPARAIPQRADVATSVVFIGKLIPESRREMGSAGVSVGRAHAGVLADWLIPRITGHLVSPPN